MAVLLAVPNVSEGTDSELLSRLCAAFERPAGVTLLDRHADPDHDRAVFTLAGEPGPLQAGLTGGAEAALETIEMSSYAGLHPAVGALDVCPLVWVRPGDRDAARTAALAVATQIAGLGIPVFLYGELASAPARAERAYFRNGGLAELAERMRQGGLRPDLGPGVPHPRAGATLITARPPLAAFNVELEGGDLESARAIAARLRESGGGPAGVRAIGLLLGDGRTQVSTNVHDPLAVPLGELVERVRELAAPLGARPVAAELVGLVPAAALEGYPADVPIHGFSPERCVIEPRLAVGAD